MKKEHKISWETYVATRISPAEKTVVVPLNVHPSVPFPAKRHHEELEVVRSTFSKLGSRPINLDVGREGQETSTRHQEEPEVRSTYSEPSQFDEEHFKLQLTKLKGSKSAILDFSKICISHRSEGYKLARCWRKVIRMERTDKKAILFYLVSEIVQVSRKRKYKKLIDKFKVAICESLAYLSDIKDVCLKCLQIWKQAKVFDCETLMQWKLKLTSRPIDLDVGREELENGERKEHEERKIGGVPKQESQPRLDRRTFNDRSKVEREGKLAENLKLLSRILSIKPSV